MEDIKESKKVLTDYMLELNADIQRAEDWVNTGADEEMYFALKTVLDRLEQLEKENKEMKEKHTTTYQLNVGLLREIRVHHVPKSVIREKIEELEHEKSKRTQLGVFILKNYDNQRLLAQIQVLKELLGEENEI